MSTVVSGPLEEAIRFAVPWTAAVAVVLPAGAEPPQLDGRRVFPIRETDFGTEEGGAALARLESLRAEKCEYLIVPAASLGWLDERPELAQSLARDYRMLERDPEAGAVYALHENADRSGPDGLPLPPVDLVRITSGCINQALRNPENLYRSFYETGVAGVARIREMLARNGVEVEELGALLDLGCGCGRVIRHWRTLEHTELHGCDYNPHLIAWCRENLDFAEFSLNSLAPELPYRDAQFDLVYAISVFTHLDAPLQLPWISEIARVVKPGGHIVLTVSGEKRAIKQLKAEAYTRFSAGELVVTRAHSSGTNACAAFHPERFVRDVLGRGLETVELVPGGAEDVRQDQVLFRKPERDPSE